MEERQAISHHGAPGRERDARIADMIDPGGPPELLARILEVGCDGERLGETRHREDEEEGEVEEAAIEVLHEVDTTAGPSISCEALRNPNKCRTKTWA